jgi:peptidyl-prolyl cis-trans isomerase SurA
MGMCTRYAVIALVLLSTQLWGSAVSGSPQQALQSAPAPLQNVPPAPQKTTSTILDRVVAVVDESAILASDVDEEMRFAALQPQDEPAADNTPQQALSRLIDRALIDQQRVLQPGIGDVAQTEVDSAIVELRKTIPACKQYRCTTDAGWLAFLKAHEFTLNEVEKRVRERLEILKFMNMRFGAAVRISGADVQRYYAHTLVPELQRNHAAVPDMQSVAPQIREILRQQRINAMVDEWLKGLRAEGDLHILDAAYGNDQESGSGTTASGTSSPAGRKEAAQ